jgi:hypothetical protein
MIKQGKWRRLRKEGEGDINDYYKDNYREVND